MKLTWAAAAWLAGLGIASRWYDADPYLPLILAALALVAGAMLKLSGVRAGPLLLLGVCLLGIWRYEDFQDEPAALLPENSAAASLQGRISSDPEATGGRIKFTLEPVATAGQPPEQAQAAQAAPSATLPTNTAATILVYAIPGPGLAELRSPPYFRYGDFVELSGRLQRPQPIEGFDYPAYLESKGIAAVLWAETASLLKESDGALPAASGLAAFSEGVRGGVYGIRRILSRSLEVSLPPEQAALAQALLLGIRGQLPQEVTDNFRNTGTSHLLAISGLHLGILLLMVVGVLQRTLGKHTPAPLLLTLALVWLYVLLSGASPSVIRAAIMGSVYLAALGLGRPRESLLPALALSASAMTAVSPALAAQISFQLSFAAMAGIALALPWQEAAGKALSQRLSSLSGGWGPVAGSLLGWAAAGMVVSAAATLVTLPLVLLYFHHFPVAGIPATLLATPLLPLSLVAAGAVALLGTVHSALGQLAGLVGAIPLAGLLYLVEWIPNWTIAVKLEDSRLSWAWYGILLAALVATDTRAYRRAVATRLAGIRSDSVDAGSVALAGIRVGADRMAVFLSVAILLAGALAYGIVQYVEGRDGRLYVHFLDVGQGDGILIETPGGIQALVDGGPDYDSATLAAGKILPYWDRSLDLVMATHLDADHSRGLVKILDNYRVGRVFVGDAGRDSPLYPEWAAALARGGHDAIALTAGQRVNLDEGVSLTILHPPEVRLRGPAWDSNNNSLALKLEYGEVSFLLTGDIESEAERHLVRRSASLESDVLKVGHHGSKSSTSPSFLAAVNPRWAVISAGAGNQYGHPHDDVVSLLEEAVGAAGIFDTASHGAISFSTDGRRLWVTTERQPEGG